MDQMNLPVGTPTQPPAGLMGFDTLRLLGYFLGLSWEPPFKQKN